MRALALYSTNYFAPVNDYDSSNLRSSASHFERFGVAGIEIPVEVRYFFLRQMFPEKEYLK